jgi:nucleoside-diphosphate-sugar epimerase
VIGITGSSGFLGGNIINYLSPEFEISKINRNLELDSNIRVLIHLAGKAHDLKNASQPDEYYQVNTDLTKKLFDDFLELETIHTFIFISSVKAVADNISDVLAEETTANPLTDYGKSKLLAEQYILSKNLPENKKVFILRPCMIHGPGNKGNLNLLFKIVNKGFPWPLGSFENKRSFCSIDNLCFIIQELIENENIPTGIYNVADDEPLSTNELIRLIADSQGKKTCIWNLPKSAISSIAKFGDLIKLPLNTERLNKLTESYMVSNAKIKLAINKPLPVTSRDGLMKTFKSFHSNG